MKGERLVQFGIKVLQYLHRKVVLAAAIKCLLSLNRMHLLLPNVVGDFLVPFRPLVVV